MLEIKNLYSGYGSLEILHGISLECKESEITTIIGPNGSGKSTLLKSIAGFTDIKSGNIFLDGKNVLSLKPNARAQKISYLSQGKDISDSTVINTVLQGRFPYLSFPRRYTNADVEKAENALKKMGIYDLKQKSLSSLSGGMRQKVYIAMALCQETNVILFDEPTTYLDVSQQFMLAKLSSELSKDSKTVLNVMHDLPLALKISDQIAVMKDGEIIKTGTPAEILKSELIPEIFGIDIVSFENEYCYRCSI